MLRIQLKSFAQNEQCNALKFEPSPGSINSMPNQTLSALALAYSGTASNFMVTNGDLHDGPPKAWSQENWSPGPLPAFEKLEKEARSLVVGPAVAS